MVWILEQSQARLRHVRGDANGPPRPCLPRLLSPDARRAGAVARDACGFRSMCEQPDRRDRNCQDQSRRSGELGRSGFACATRERGAVHVCSRSARSWARQCRRMRSSMDTRHWGVSAKLGCDLQTARFSAQGALAIGSSLTPEHPAAANISQVGKMLAVPISRRRVSRPRHSRHCRNMVMPA